ncbi:DUF2694 domain-containing protein [Kibdelosporangium philippinense]|uniref:DUF2694 domain-containing protein n=1 Tax=Kibdelosporangium philippinense TaxID=211113 RepID=A0ABS8ZGG6_9PSEU|nr:DUF2694 domain-containing protein [Kibdelosporangium philippinense]MCE7006921.1 DUF2694 domain-containing protein [Kibdelosporangium philippinense]
MSDIESILDCARDVAQVIVDELDAAGYIQSGDAGRIIVLRRSHGGRSGLFYNVVSEVSDETDRLARLVGEADMRSLNQRLPRDIPVPEDVREWIGTHGVRAQTMLTIVWEHGWAGLARRLADGLARLWFAVDQFENAAVAVGIAQEAQAAIHHERSAELSMRHAEVLSATGRTDDAVRAATSAVLHAHEAANTDLLASAYQVRGEIHHQGHNPVAAVQDYQLAERAALRAVRHAPLDDRSVLRTDPDRVTARVSNAITPLDRAAASLTVGPDPRMYAALLVERANELSIAGQADAVGVQLARLVRKFTGTLPEVEAADIATTVGRAAERNGQADLANLCYLLAAEHYTGAGQYEDAKRVDGLLATTHEPHQAPPPSQSAIAEDRKDD